MMYSPVRKAAGDFNVDVALEVEGFLVLHGTRAAVTNFVRHSGFFAQLREVQQVAVANREAAASVSAADDLRGLVEF
jgi:hypothetical protein